jgi:hypothetical protein
MSGWTIVMRGDVQQAAVDDVAAYAEQRGFRVTVQQGGLREIDLMRAVLRMDPDASYTVIQTLASMRRRGVVTLEALTHMQFERFWQMSGEATPLLLALMVRHYATFTDVNPVDLVPDITVDDLSTRVYNRLNNAHILSTVALQHVSATALADGTRNLSHRGLDEIRAFLRSRNLALRGE